MLEDKATQLKMGNYNSLSSNDKKKVIKIAEPKYVAYLVLNNSNTKMHNQLNKEYAKEVKNICPRMKDFRDDC